MLVRYRDERMLVLDLFQKANYCYVYPHGTPMFGALPKKHGIEFLQVIAPEKDSGEVYVYL